MVVKLNEPNEDTKSEVKIQLDDLAQAESEPVEPQQVEQHQVADKTSTRETDDEIVPVAESSETVEARDHFDGPCLATEKDSVTKVKGEKEALKKRIKSFFKKIKAFWEKKEHAFYLNLWKFAGIHIYKLILLTIALVCINKVIFQIVLTLK